MTATDELRRLLDERGVEYDGETYEGVTFWNEDTNKAIASGDYGEKLWVSQCLTPEQAVEATLGSDLQAENAKLRELVRDMYEDIVYGCAECFFPKYSEHSGKPSECDNGGCGYRQIADRMLDLGVEI